MRGLKALVSILMLWTSSSAFSFDFNSSYYAIYETAAMPPYGCAKVFIVPQNMFLILGVDQPTPIMFMPQTTGFQGWLCLDGSLSSFSKVSLTASDMAAQGATPSTHYKLYGGDFEGDGKPDFFLQGNGTVTNSVILTADSNGTPQIYSNFYGALSSTVYPQINILDVDQNGRSDIVAKDNYGNVVTYFSSELGNSFSSANTGGNTTTLVGAINGKFRVDESGNSTYSVDVLTAAGTAGVVPHISLNYSSSGGDGVMGTGWSIGGLSAITRCRQTLAQDNNATAITLGASDRFCLDGQRLILKTGTYGADGSTYRTEIDSYAVITAVGGSAGNPAYFTVVRKDGSTSYYGNGNSSQLVLNGNGPVLTWAISRFQDSVGNPIRYSYMNNAATNEQLISRIDYGYGSNTGATDNSTTYLSFSYAARPDASSGYIAGSRIQRTQRLTTVTSYNNGTEIRHYTLAYRTTDSTHYQSYVQQLMECVGSNCLSPTTFNWSLNSGGFQAGVQVSTVGGSTPVAVRTMDINGDGKADLVWMQQTAPYNLYYQLWSGSGYSSPVQFGSIPDGNTNWLILDKNNDGYQDLLVGSGRGNWQLYLGGQNGLVYSKDTGVVFNKYAAVVDLNGDGLIDYVAGDTATNYYYKLNSRSVDGSSWLYSFTTNQPVSLDMTPILGCSFTGTLNLSSKNLIDFDGDGRIDLLLSTLSSSSNQNCNFYQVVLTPGNPVSRYVATNWSNISQLQALAMEASAAFTSWAPPQVDVNGDGLADVIQLSNDSANDWWELDTNTGRGFTSASIISSCPYSATVTIATCNSYPMALLNNYNFSPLIADYNGDGYPDLMYGVNGFLRMRLFNPATQSFPVEVTTEIPYQAQSNNIVGDQDIFVDVDGDGHLDLLRVQGTSSQNNIILYKSNDAGKASNKIVGIDNGLGSTTNINYKPLTDPSVYTKAHDANDANKWPGAPVFDIVAPSYVVSSVNSTAPTANNANPNQVNYSATATVSYQYAGLKMQASGRGSLGFASITTTDPQSNVVTTTTYNQAFPFIGQPLATTQKSLRTGITFKMSNNAQAKIPHTGADGTTYYQIYTPNVTEATSDPVTGSLISNVMTQTAAPDEWGNVWGSQASPGIVVKTYYTLFAPVKTMSTYNEYGSTDYDKQFSRLSKTVVTHSRPGYDDIQRTSNFTYYDQSAGNLRGLLKSEQVTTPDGSASAMTTYQYDIFGNKKCVSTGTDTNMATNCTPSTSNRYEITDYDSAGRYVVDKQSPFNLATGWTNVITEQVISRNALGLPTQVNGLNGLVTNYTYDALGRESSRKDNTGAAMATSYARYGVWGSQYNVTTTTNTGAIAMQYFDALGRSIAKWQKGFDGSWIASETEYDNVGRVKRQSVPHYDGATVYWATNNYDEFRLQSQTVPATGGATATTSMLYGIAFNGVYNGLSYTLITNALNQTRKEYRNAAGELLWVVDTNGNTINYEYDAAGQLIDTTTTGKQNGASTDITTYLTYDQLGRKIKMQDSDKGTWFYDYDEFGALADQYKITSTNNYAGNLEQALADSSVQMQLTSMLYDIRGRMIERDDMTKAAAYTVNNRATWTYDTAANGIGLLAQEKQIKGANVTRTYSYDSLGRPASTLHSLDNTSYLLTTSYDGFGRPQEVTDALGTDSKVINTYNDYGYLQSVTDWNTGTAVYSVQGMDARGNVTSATYGNGTVTSWIYDQGSGLLTDQTTTNVLGVTLQSLAYTWDALGNQTSRWDRGIQNPSTNTYKNLQQSFCYDSLNRLIKTNQGSLNGSCTGTQDQQYDDFGNIVSKNNVGAYTYNPASPHQLQATGDGVAYTYDTAGNLTSDTSGRTLYYTAFDKVSAITKGTNQITFTYGPDRNVYKRVDTASSGTTTTYTIGNVEKVIKSDGSYDMKRYIGGVALWNYHFDSTGTPPLAHPVDMQYMYKDALGSVVMIAGGSGAVKQQYAFNAWGERVDATDWQSVLASTTFLPVSQQFTTQSYTGQEALDAVGLINYGGRIYDPRLGRFVQADPLVDDGEDLQAYNRYAYVRNNPLTLTDPSGFSIWGKVKHGVSSAWHHATHAIEHFGSQGAELAMRWTDVGQLTYHIDAVLPYEVAEVGVTIGSAFCTYGYAGCVAAGTYVNDRAHGMSPEDSFRAGGIAGASAYAFSQVGGQFQSTPAQAFSTMPLDAAAVYSAESIVTHGVVGGVMSVLQGGRFGDGFVSAGLSTGLSLTTLDQGTNWYDVAGRIAVAAAAGGTVSELTGGKFANGAVTAAFEQAFNGERHNIFDTYVPDDQLNAAARTVLQNRELLSDGSIVVYPPETFLMTPTRGGNGIIYYDPTVNFDPLNDNANTIRIMFQSKDPRTPAPYMRFFNENGQAISPYSGKTGSNSQTHYPLSGVKLDDSQ
jgi:RHS repeat-associated protein